MYILVRDISKEGGYDRTGCHWAASPPLGHRVDSFHTKYSIMCIPLTQPCTIIHFIGNPFI